LTITFAPLQRLINKGAVYTVVPGNPPSGCSPIILTLRSSSLNKTEDYDHLGCLSDINRVARNHNTLLRTVIVALRVKYPHARIIFADFYKPIISILENTNRFGKMYSIFSSLGISHSVRSLSCLKYLAIHRSCRR
jgi:hypothetical protein